LFSGLIRRTQAFDEFKGLPFSQGGLFYFISHFTTFAFVTVERIFRYCAGLSLAAILVFWALSNLYPIEPMEIRLVEPGAFGWLKAPLAARLFIAFQFVLAALLLLNLNPRNRTIKWLALLLALALPDLIWEAFRQEKIITHCYGCVTGYPDGWNLLAWLWLITGSGLLLRSKKGNDWRFRWVKYVVIISMLPLAWIFNPVYPEDFQDNTSVQPEPLEAAFLPDSLTNKTYILAMLDPGCPHCRHAAQKMAVSKIRYRDFPEMFTVLHGDSVAVNYFFHWANVRPEHQIVPFDDFFRLAGPRFPAIFYVRQDMVMKKWTGHTFNYEVLHRLSQGGVATQP